MDPSREIPAESFDQPEGSKLARKMKESPFMVAGKFALSTGYRVSGDIKSTYMYLVGSHLMPSQYSRKTVK